MGDRNGVRTLLWLAAALGFMLMIFGAGYASLDAKKADRDVVAEMARDIRAIRDFLMGRAYP